MKKVIVLLLYSFNLLAQEDTNYVTYYNMCDDAIKHIQNKEFKEGLRLFEKSFRKVKNPNYRHLYYAGRTAFLAEKTEKMYHYFELAYLNGCYYLLEQDTLIYNSLKHDKRFQELVKNQDSLLAIFDSKINKKVKCIIDSLDRIDQSIREELNELNDDSENSYKKDSLWGIDDEKNRFFLDYVKENGYPSYREIGNDFSSILLIHCGNYFKEYEDVLLMEVRKGNLEPYFFAQIYDRTYGPDSCIYKAYHCNSYVTKDEIIKNRRLIGLETFNLK